MNVNALKKWACYWAAAILLLANATCSASTDQANKEAHLHGVVTDDTESRISGVALTFTSERENIVLTSAADGTYSATLRPGRYSVQAKLSPFCELHRSEILVSRAADIRVDLQMHLCGMIDSTTFPEERTNPADLPYKCYGLFCEETLDEMVSLHVRPVVTFAHRAKQDAKTTYTGVKIGRVYASPEFTVDRFSLHATTLILSSNTMVLKGIGEVKWQDGYDTWRGQEIAISLKDGVIMVVRKESTMGR